MFSHRQRTEEENYDVEEEADVVIYFIAPVKQVSEDRLARSNHDDDSSSTAIVLVILELTDEVASGNAVAICGGCVVVRRADEVTDREGRRQRREWVRQDVEEACQGGDAAADDAQGRESRVG